MKKHNQLQRSLEDCLPDSYLSLAIGSAYVTVGIALWIL